MRHCTLLLLLLSLACATTFDTVPQAPEGFAFIEKNSSKKQSTAASKQLVDHTHPVYQITKQVFDKLVEARGDFRMRVPQLVMSHAERKVAIARPRKAEITLEMKAYDVCRGFGKDSLNALAVLLSHELIHYYEKHDWTNHFAKLHSQTNTASQLQHLEEGLKLETQADYLGGFLAYSAGYQPLDIMPRLLDAIYDAYGLTEEIKGYPSLKDRKTIATQSLQKLQRLIYVFETSTYLLATEQYEASKAYLEFILKDFQSRELYNNLGIITAQAAIPHLSPQQVKYILPLELDGEIRLLSNLKNTGRSKSAAQSFLRQSLRYFEQASQLDRHYPIAILNLACVYALLEEYEDASFYTRKALKLCNNPKWKKTAGDVLVLQGMIADWQGDELAATRKFEQAIKSGNKLGALNLMVLQNEPIRSVAAGDLPLMPSQRLNDFNLDRAIAQTLGGDFTSNESISINKQTICGFSTIETSKIYTHFTDEDHYAFFQIVNPQEVSLEGFKIIAGQTQADITEQYGSPDRNIELSNGKICVYYKSKLILQFDEADQLKAFGLFRYKN